MKWQLLIIAMMVRYIQALVHPVALPPDIAQTQWQVSAGWAVQYVQFGSGQGRPGLPVRIKIPAIGVDAAIVSVGITPDGIMDATKDPREAGWFDPGSRPGEVGSAVIAGHFGIWKNGISAVFNNISRLRAGDMISIQDEEGVTTTFVVRSHRRYDPEADASGVFGSSDGQSHLNLVTCEGSWDPISQSYSQRLVVFADKE